MKRSGETTMKTSAATTHQTLTPIWKERLKPFWNFALDGAEVYVFCRFMIQARSAVTGDLLREEPTTWEWVWGQTAFDEEHLFIPAKSHGIVRMTKDFTQHNLLWPVGDGVCNATRHGDWLYCTCWDIAPSVTGQPQHDTLAKISLAAGQVAFEVPAGEICCPAVVVNDTVYASSADRGLSAFHEADLALKWPCAEVGRLSDPGTALVEGEVLFVPEDIPGRVHQVSTAIGHINWSQPVANGQPRTFLTLWENAVYGGTASTLYKLNRDNGQVLKTLDDLPDIAYPSHIVPCQGCLWLAAGQFIIRLDPAGLVPVASYIFPGAGIDSFTIVDSTLYVASYDYYDTGCVYLGAYPLPP
jgi:hypothetical protein